MKMLSVIVPVYNEGAHLQKIVKYLLEAPCPVEREWIFVDDCSTDDSLSVLQSLAQIHRFKLVQQTVNQGKGAAICRGIQEATGDYILIQDADFEYNPYDIPALIEPIREGRADVVYGSRFKKNAMQVHRTYHYFVNRLLTLLSNLFSGIYLTDMETCYKIFPTDLLKAIPFKSKRFGIEVELTAYAAKLQIQIYELPISYFPRNQLQGKKINWKDGVAALFHLIRFNFFVSADEVFAKVPQQYRLQRYSKRLLKAELKKTD